MTGWIASKAAVGAGDLRVLLAMTRTRISDLPDTPTALELTTDPKKKQTIQSDHYNSQHEPRLFRTSEDE